MRVGTKNAMAVIGVASCLMAVSGGRAAADGPYNWTGLYLGADLGERLGHAKWTTDSVPSFAPAPPIEPRSGEMGSNGFHGNGRLGYNWQSGSLVTGIEANLGYANSSKSISYIPGTFSAIDPQPGDSMSTKLGWDGSIRGRLGGLLTPELLVYGTGGVAFQAATVSASCSGVTSHWCTFSHNESVSKTLTGWTLGAGAEAMLTAHWVARVEYSHADFGKFSNSFLLGPAGFAGIDQINGSSKITTDNVSLGLSYKF